MTCMSSLLEITRYPLAQDGENFEEVEDESLLDDAEMKVIA